MARVFDCFTFFNEFDLLEIRLHELSEVVDCFVLAEAATTFSGNPKPLYFLEHRERYAKFRDRIVHIVVDDPPRQMDSSWGRQIHQRNALIRGLDQADADDLILLSDADEIPRAQAVRAVSQSVLGRFDVLCFELRMYNYFVNFERDETWLRSGPRAVCRRYLNGMERLRKVKGPIAEPIRDAVRALRSSYNMGRPVRRITIPDAGWHFTYLGGIEAIHQKVRSFSGHKTVSEEILDPDRLTARIRAGLSTDTRRNTRLTYRPLDESFPPYLLENRERFSHLILDENDAAKFVPSSDNIRTS